VVLFQYNRLNSFLLCAALMLMGACASTVPEVHSDLKVEVVDASVWFDHMPGMKERGYASFELTITNSGPDTLVITEAIGTIRDRRNTPPFRKFSCNAENVDRTGKTIQILPSQTSKYRFRSTAGFIPFDINRYPQVIAGVTLMLSNSEIVRAERSKIDVFIAQ
jgi:hypothetical protein